MSVPETELPQTVEDLPAPAHRQCPAAGEASSTASRGALAGRAARPGRKPAVRCALAYPGRPSGAGSGGGRGVGRDRLDPARGRLRRGRPRPARAPQRRSRPPDHRAQAAPHIERFLGLDLSTKLSQAALEALAVIAYRQPFTRAEIEAIRGVGCDGVLRTLISRELVEPVGRLEQPGRPYQYGTTVQFLQYFGLESLDRLPPLPESAAPLPPNKRKKSSAIQAKGKTRYGHAGHLAVRYARASEPGLQHRVPQGDPMSENLWALREQKKLSVATLAGRAGLPIGLILEYESGQRSVDVRHISRLARALYIEESEIKLRSDPRPGAGALENQPRREDTPRPAEPSAPPSARPQRDMSSRPPRPAPAPRPPLPARPSQITHLQDLLLRLGRPQAEVEAEVGKPLAELDRLAASQLLVKLQTEMKEGKFAERHRAYLPEAVDQFEFRYLTAAQQAGDVLHFILFDNSAVAGQVIGFGQYNITVRVGGRQRDHAEQAGDRELHQAGVRRSAGRMSLGDTLRLLRAKHGGITPVDIEAATTLPKGFTARWSSAIVRWATRRASASWPNTTVCRSRICGGGWTGPARRSAARW